MAGSHPLQSHGALGGTSQVNLTLKRTTPP